jgi:hypothetical protein
MFILGIFIYTLVLKGKKIRKVNDQNNYISLNKIYFLFKYNIFTNLGGYNGIIHLFASISFFVGFYLLPSDSINTCSKRLIKQITSYTNGIYCLHSKIILIFKERLYLLGFFKSIFIIIQNKDISGQY